MTHPDQTPPAEVSEAEVPAAEAPATEVPEAEVPAPEPVASEPVEGELVPTGETPPATDGTDPDDDAVDAELVAPVPPPPAVTFSTTTHAPAFDYTDAGVPTLGYLQDKIDRRYATALGATELAGQDERAKAAAKRVEDREQAAADKLAEIRRSLHPEG